ncbi:hypothetical protein Terro_4369 [Terriglobus roseus DSM 18391]|uniref:Oligosaccharide repeat unit polymerase n=1 Tax=Terriglobus roseus (strain DSM 18391 / NRRL B-41598 / KBS 63) TaxID=926566 RepID=I3ZMU8_TERRK|nr:O-antigen polymerase [Terriglobus roseus]AFL90566.1 hypothetical protein Terro_4369 [Terriglobus roseus DSM 18391]
MLIALLTAYLGALTFANYRLKRSVLYPPFLFCGMWFLTMTLSALQIVETDPLHGTVLFLVGAGALCFTIGGAVAALLPAPLVETRLTLWPRSRKPRQDHFMKYVYLGVMILSMILIARQTILTGLSRGGVAGILANARAAGVEGTAEGGFALLAYMPSWTIYTAVLFAVERRNRMFWIAAVVAFISAVFTTGRAPIMQLFISLIVVFMVQTNRTRFLQAVRIARIPMLIFFALYVGLIFTTKNLSTMEGGVVSIATYFVVSYIVGPVAAMDYVIEHPSLYSAEVHHTFKFPLGIAARLHLFAYEPPPLLDTFVAIPFPANVYTGYKFFYTDFGLFGTLIVALVIGFLHTLLYRKGTQRGADGEIRSELGLYCFACSITALVLFIFDDLYSAMGLNLTILLFGSLYFAVRNFSPLGAAGRRSSPAAHASTLA